MVYCPPDFKYVQEGGTQKCVYATNNARAVVVNSLPKPESLENLPASYRDEQRRVSDAVYSIRRQVEIETDMKTALKNAQAQGNAWESQYGAIQSTFSSYENDAEKVREVADSLKPHRPKIAPQEDLEKERRAITETVQKNYLLIQISLFLVFAVMFVYVVVPVKYAHFIAFLLLLSGVMIGIFLRK